MTSLVPIRRALLSVSRKQGLADFARRLIDAGAEIISTGGTAAALKDAGIPVTPIEDVTGFPEMLDGRVKTLHPAVHGGLLGRRDNPEHLEAMAEYGMAPIDLICINLYPFEDTIAGGDVTELEAIEQIDIGGPAMIRSAAKNHAFVTVVTDASQYPLVIADLNGHDGATTLDLRRDLAAAAFRRTAEYDAAIAGWFEGEGDLFPTHLCIRAALEQVLRYGENPDQSAAIYRTGIADGASVVTARSVAGKPLSYNNIIDAAAALELVKDLHALQQGHAAAVIKHTNPCGAATADSPESAFTAAWKGDQLAAFGGIVALDSPVDQELARIIADGEKFFEVIVAPSFADAARVVLQKRWKNIRLLEVGDIVGVSPGTAIRSVHGGLLTQTITPAAADTGAWEVQCGDDPSPALRRSMAFAWVTCSHLKSNAIAITDGHAMIGAGMGQVDRVSAARQAIGRAGDRLGRSELAIAASDAFFPFPDGAKALIDAGVQCIVQPGGSVRDQETIDLCRDHHVTLIHTGRRCFRH